MTTSTAFCFVRLRHYRTLLSPTPSHLHPPISTQQFNYNTIHPNTTHTSTITMFRRVAAAVPSQAGRVLSTVRPNIASPIRTAAPTLASAGRRQYHEKDKSFSRAIVNYRETRWRRVPIPRKCLRRPLHLDAHTLSDAQLTCASTARPLQPPAQRGLHVQSRQRRWYRPRRRPGVRRRHEAPDPRGPQQQHHQRRQVQDVWVR